jgi:hypothetical protein
MAELLIRAGAADAALIERVLSGAAEGRPHRLVVDAHVSLREPRLSQAARTAGIPLIVDPQTHFLQDFQHGADPWAQLPFGGGAQPSTPMDLLNRSRLDDLVAAVVEHQLEAGATVVVPPYLHIESRDDGWCEAQIAMWHATRRYLDAQGLQLPVLAVVALGWRLLEREAWPYAFGPLVRAMATLRPTEVAVAASKVDAGSKADERLATFIAVIRRLARDYPVVAWQQGILGAVAVAAGAVGYECGIGWRERCDLRTAMASRRKPSSGGSARPVYISALSRGIPKSTFRLLLDNPRIAAGILCLDITCCPNGRRDLLEDAREHAIRARLRSLRHVTQPAQPAWRWNLLAKESAMGIQLADRINTIACQTIGMKRVDETALRATHTIAEHRRQSLSRHRAA